MKKLLGILFGIILLSGIACMPAYAADTYTVPNIELDFTIPDGLYYFTKDMDPEDSALSHFNLTPEQISDLFGEDDFMIIVPSDNRFELDLSCEINENNFTNSNTLTDEELEEVIKRSLSEGIFGEDGDNITFTINDMSVHKGNIKYILVHFNAVDNDTNESYVVTFVTCARNGYEFDIWGHDLSQEDEHYLTELMDSIVLKTSFNLSNIDGSIKPTLDENFSFSVSMQQPTTTRVSYSEEDTKIIGIVVAIAVIVPVVIYILVNTGVFNKSNRKKKNKIDDTTDYAQNNYGSINQTGNDIYNNNSIPLDSISNPKVLLEQIESRANHASTYPTSQPTAYPISQPTAYPTSQPTAYPASQPAAYPTSQPTAYPTSQPTASPVTQPAEQQEELKYNISSGAFGACKKCGNNAQLYRFLIIKEGRKMGSDLCGPCAKAMKDKLDKSNGIQF